MKTSFRICLAASAGILMVGGLRAADPVPQEQPSFSPVAGGNWNLEWPGVERRTYFVQYSRDLVNWTYCPVIRHGPGMQAYEVRPVAAAGFYVRLKYPNQDVIETLEEARNADFDGDGLPNWREIEELAADPFDAASVGPDGDDDGMPDWWEAEHGLDGLDPGDAGEDPDSDALSNLEEFRARTDPGFYDSDRDRFPDGFEARTPGYDPLVPDADGDADGDGLTDIAEVGGGTNPLVSDSDADGVSDAVEVARGSDALDPQRRPFDPTAFSLTAITESAVQPMGDLGVNYSAGNRYRITISLKDNLQWFGPAPGTYFTEQEGWRLLVGEKRQVETNPFPVAANGGWFAPYQTIGAEMVLDETKVHRLVLQHLGVAGPASPGVEDSPVADFRHTLFVSCPGFVALTNEPSIPPLNSVSQSSNSAGYDWRTRQSYLIPLSSVGYASSHSGGDAAGPRFRRISHFGRPIPEFTPEQETEGDQSGEESHVDAFDLSLRHDTSFASIPLAASELRLEASASTRETIWSSRSGLRPAEDLTSPFGISWSSNLCAYIEVVETMGNSGTRPTTVNVVDEGGRGQRFGSSDGLSTFFPWSSGVVDKKSALNELQRSGNTLVLKKKFGNTLTYRPCNSWFLYSADRMDASDAVRRHTYWRLEEVVDRLGQKVLYDYGGSPYSLIPVEIRAFGRPGQKLEITRSANGRRVTEIKDAVGNITRFHYVDRSITAAGTSTAYAYQELARVTFPGGIEEFYGYDVVADPETLNGKVTHHFHANLASLRRGNGAERVFSYAFDRSRKWLDSSLGRIAIRASLNDLPADLRQRARDYVASVNSQPQGGSVQRVQYGVPRRVTGVTWPALGLASTFAKTADTRTLFGPQFQGVSGTLVTDTAGKRYQYNFGGVKGEIVDTDTTISGGTTSISTDWLIQYPQMTLSYLDPAGAILGSESFEFDPAAGLALKRVVDFTGNETRWEYAESRPPGARLALKSDPAFLSKWPDPTAKTDALGRIERYEYGTLRILSKSTDAHGTVTEYGVDALGRRTSMIVTDFSGTRLVEESYAYGHPVFPGFMTRKTRVAFANRSGKAWEQDLVTDYHPDALGRLAREVVDPGGLNLETLHSYDLNGRKLTSRDPNGNLTSFEYDAMGRLEKVTHADGYFTRSVYDANNLKILEEDEKGQITLFERDGLGRLTATVRDLDGDGVASAGDPTTRLAYDKAGSVRKVTDPRGFATVTFYDHLHRPANVFQGVPAAAADGDLVALNSLAAGSRAITRSELFYEAASNPGGGLLSPFKATRTIRHGAVSVVRGQPDVSLGITTAFDKIYRQTAESVEYLPGLFRSSSMEHGVVEGGRESLVTTSTDALGKVTRTTRDGLGREIEVVDGHGLADPGLIHLSSTHYSSTGLAWRVVDPLGRRSETDYDAAGRPVRVWQPDPVTGLVSGDSPVTETIYDANGNGIAVIDPLGRRSDFDFDNRNRKWRSRAPAVTDAADPDAPVLNVRPVTITTFDPVGNAIAVTDARGSTVRTFYDRANRPVVTRSNPATGAPSADRDSPGMHDITSTTVLDPGGLALAITDGNGNTTRNAYDGLGRLVATVCDPADGDPVDPAAPGFDASAYRASGPDGLLVTNVHDDAGNIVEVTDGKGQRTAFTYDGLARKTRTIRDPETTVERVDTAEFNALHQTRRIDAKGAITLYRHDSRHRLTDVVYAPQGAAVTSVHPDNRQIQYDRADRVLAVGFPNELNSPRATASTYDHLDRLTSETSAGVTHLYPSYDKAGNRLQVIYGRSGTTLVCAYDALNRLLECEERSNAAVPSGRFTRYAYDAGGKVTRKTLPNGTSATSRFDRLGRTLEIVEKDSSGAVLSSFDYSVPVGGWPGSHDAAGNVLRCAETYSKAGMADRVVANSYDRCHRLVTETITPAGGAAAVTVYGYDLANNRTTRSINGVVTRYLYGDGTNGANSNQLTGFGPDGQPATHGFTYDANGNRESRTTAGGGDSYSWDFENRLVGLIRPAGSYRYGYDPRSRRVVRDESLAGGSLSLLTFSGGLSVQEADSGGVLQSETIRGSDWGGGTGGVLYSIRQGQRSYKGYNSRGDVVSTTDDSGAATWQAAYEAFGTRTAEQGANNDRQRANTKDEDPTGLLNEGFRYRDLETGIFISRDPAGFVDGPNDYTYVRQNPWTMFDPEGLFMQHFGDWAAAKFGAPPAPVCFMAKHSGKVTGTVHAINGAVSFVPGLGKIADGLDATISAAEGDYTAAALTAGGGKAGQLMKKGFQMASATIVVGKVVTHADEAVDATRTIANSVDEVVDQAKTVRNVVEEAVGKVETRPLGSKAYDGVKEASAYLKAQGVPRNVRKQVLDSFEVATIKVRQAGASEYGLRFFDDVTAKAKGRYLFETFPASRSSLALDPKWNQMSALAQWRIKPGATLFEGVASPQGVGLDGGQIQKFIPDLDDLVSP